MSAAEGLEELAARAGDELEGAHPTDILRWAIGEFGEKFAITSSMGDAVLATLASSVAPGVKVIFLDTGYHFAETIGTRDAVATVLPVEILSVRPEQTVAEQDAEYGEKLYARDPDLCCRLRKVQPLERTLAGFTAWASGIRRDESETRRDVRVVDWDAKRSMVKVNPLATWTADDVDTYIAEAGVLVNPLTYDGYPSIGCAPCTHRVAEGADPRSGRWSGSAKTECGLHV